MYEKKPEVCENVLCDFKTILKETFRRNIAVRCQEYGWIEASFGLRQLGMENKVNRYAGVLGRWPQVATMHNLSSQEYSEGNLAQEHHHSLREIAMDGSIRWPVKTTGNEKTRLTVIWCGRWPQFAAHHE